ncbi:hypothetical protein BDR05DRAFT_223574 [Suillus weaverae]|nr:hypothetical protein BDR05DRAFT_223574 [Suillus weaverae]
MQKIVGLGGSRGYQPLPLALTAANPQRPSRTGLIHFRSKKLSPLEPIPTAAHRARWVAHVLSPSHSLNYPCRSHNSDRPSTPAHRPSPSPRRASRKSHPVQKKSLTTQPSLEVWNTLLATSQPPSCSYASHSKPRQQPLP